MAHTCQDCKNSLKCCFHSDLLRISIFLLYLHTPKEGYWCHLRDVSCWLLQWWLFVKRVYTLPTRQQGSGRGHLCPRLRLWCWGAVQHNWQLEAFQNSCSFARFDSFHEAGDLEVVLSCMLCISFFFESPRKCGCPIDKAMLDGMCVNCLERGLNCSAMGSEVCSAQALPGFARLKNESRAYKCLTADRCNATQATWLICHVRVVLLLFEGRGVWNIRILPPWDCSIWERLRWIWMWMWMLWQLRMAMASTAQPAQPAPSVLQATRKSCVRAARQTSFLPVSAASNAPKRLISVQPRPLLHLSLHWSLRLVQAFGYGCGGQFKPNNLQAL